VPGRTYPLWRCAEFAALFLAFAPVPAALADTDDGIRLGALRAHLYYERSGFLSDDLIARDPPFVGWNTVIGAGDALEPADNILVVVVLDNPGGEVRLAGNAEALRRPAAGARVHRFVLASGVGAPRSKPRKRSQLSRSRIRYSMRASLTLFCAASTSTLSIVTGS